MNLDGVQKEINRDDSHLTNHQRLKDREMQRAFDAGSSQMTLPTRSRMRRAHTTQKMLEEAETNAGSLPMPDTSINA